jgi:hypothetical protein
LSNRGIKIPVGHADNPVALVEAYEQRTWPTSEATITIEEYSSFSGTYLPAVARPLAFNNGEMFNPLTGSENDVAKRYRREHATLASDLERCFDVVSPDERNYETFGIQFEKALYFACIGTESLFKRIFAANEKTGSFTMNDYVKLKSILRVDDYALSLVHYPWLPYLRPFLGWDSAHPSQSLSWFEAYNSMKHDKQQNRHRATLSNALNAAAGYYVTTFAVFGNQMFDGYIGEQFFFQFEAMPNWKVEERYFGPPHSAPWQQRTLPL